jgi:hypothetical protein
MLHIVPFLHDAVFHRVRDLQHGARGCCFVAAHYVFDDEPIVAFFFGAQDGTAYY